MAQPRLSRPGNIVELKTNVVSSAPRITAQARAINRELLDAQRASLPRYYITDVLYSMFSTSDIEEMTVLQLSNANDNGTGGLNDPRLGARDYNSICNTCHQDFTSCPNHYGRIKLPEPLVNPAWVEFVLRTLASVCNGCGSLLIPKESLRNTNSMNGLNRSKYIYVESKNLTCKRDNVSNCKACPPNPYFALKESKERFRIVYRRENVSNAQLYYMPVEATRNIFNCIDDESARYLGYEGQHPRNTIMDYLLVLPPVDRPLEQKAGSINDNQLTTYYRTIIKLALDANNIKLKLRPNNINTSAARTIGCDSNISNISNPESLCGVRPEDYISESFAVPAKKAFSKKEAKTTFDPRKEYDDKIEKILKNILNIYGLGSSPSATKNIKSIRSNISGKEGDVRDGSMGKRVNYVFRSVLGPDPSIAFGCIGIPNRARSSLARLETICKFNRDELQRMIKNGEANAYYPLNGVQAGKRIPITLYNRNTIVLENGDKVERWGKTGDLVLFNRQPTIHKESIRAMRAIFGPWETIRLHLSDTKPSNADFDGDEGNVISLYDYEAVAEASEIINTTECIMNPQRNAPMIGLHMDAITGMGELTDPVMDYPENYFSEDEFGRLLNSLVDADQIKTLDARLARFKINPRSGRAAFSALLPEKFVYSRNTSDGGVIITDGILVKGRILAADVAPKPRSIIQFLWKYFGRDVTATFITNASYMAYTFLDMRPVTVGFTDCLPTNPMLALRHKKIVREAMAEAQSFVDAMSYPTDNPYELERQEQKISQRLSGLRKLGADVSLKSFGPTNNLNRIISIGTKGDQFNAGQIGGSVGSQFIRGKRPAMDPESRRCISYDPPNSTSVASRGYCKSSFMKGLTPGELYFHQAASREGLVDTSINTAQTGHKHHELVKGLEDLRVSYDNTVRNAFGEIFQFVYGGDGLDPKDSITITDPWGNNYVSFGDMYHLADTVNALFGF